MAISSVGSPSPSAPAAPVTAVARPPPQRRFIEVLDERLAARPWPPPEPARPAASGRQEGGSLVHTILTRSFASEARLESAVQAALRGRTFSPAQLLALQIETFRHAQVVEVVSRTIDKVTSGVKQLLGTPL